MSILNLTDLRTQVNNDIKTNGVRAITGNIMNINLIDMIDSIEDDYDGITGSLDTRLTNIESSALLILQDPLTGWDASVGTFPGGATGNAGFYWNVSVAGVVDGVSFDIGDSILQLVNNASTTVYAANWNKEDNIDAVISVAGKVGAITLVAADITDFDTEVANNVDVAANTAKLTNTAANTIKGNNTGSPSDTLDLTQTEVTAMMNVFSSTLKGVVPASGGGTINFLRADGSWQPATGGDTIFTGGTMAADSTIAMANKKVTFSGGNLDQTNSAVINTITGTSAGSLSDSAYYNDTGVRSQFLMGGSTYGVGGNLELINDTFGIRTTDDFPIGSRNGVIKFSLGGDFTNANTRVKFTPTGAIFGAAVGLISAGAELDVRGAAKIATDLTLTTGDITQTNNVVVNTITATSAGSLSEFAYYNDTGIRGQLLMGGSTYGVGGNLELINNTFGIRTTDDFPIGSRNGDIKFSLGADFTNANTRAKFTSTGAIFGAAVGLVSAGAELHVKSSGSIDSTTAVLVQNLLGADLLEVKDGGSTTIYGNLTQTKATLVNSLTSSASNTFGEHNFISDNGTKGFIYWGGSTYAGGSNTALINNSFCIGSRATADNFVLTANSGGILFTLGGFMNDANTRVKISTLGTVIAGGSAASTVAQETLHLNGRFYMLNTSVPSTPTSGGVTYVEGGSLKFKGSSGTVTVLAPA
jgi:hypothetical protein